MEFQAGKKAKTEKKVRDKLPLVLGYYKDSDFTIQQKVRFIYHLCIVAIVGVILLVLSTINVQYNSPGFNILYSPVILSELVLLLVFGSCIFLLIKGKYSFSTHLFMITAMACVWFALFVSTGHIVSRLNTIILIIALFNLLPLFITKYKVSIVYYIVANLFMLIGFTLYIKDQFNLSDATTIDFITDTSIAIIFSGIVGYNIFKINRQALEKAEKDFSERRKVESVLTESELKYRTLFDHAQIGIYQTTPEGVILQSNPALIKMLGFDSLEELSKRNTNEENAYVNSSRKAFVDLIEKQGFVKDFESEWKTKNEESIIIRENARIVRDSKGNTIYYEGFVENITEKKKAEKTLKESEEKYRTLMESMSEVIMMVDNDDRVQYVNKKFTETLGYTSEEIIGEIGYQKLLDPKDHEIIIRENEKRKKNHLSQYKLSFIAKNGDKIDFLVSGSPVKDAQGKTIGSMGAMTDITERKKNQKELKESEEKYRTLMESMNEVVMMIDNQDRIQYVNKKFTETLGYFQEEIIGEIGFKFLYDENQLEVINRASFNRSKNIVFPYELSFAAKSGQKINFLVSAAPMKNSDGDAIGFILAMADITEKKIIERELEKHRLHLEFLVQQRTEELATTNEELVSTNEELHNQREELEAVLLNLQETQKQLIQAEKMASLGVLASGVAHEINNPLNFIQGGVYGLEQYFDENLIEHKDNVRELIKSINIGIDRAANIVTSLNHYNRRNDSKLEPCDIHSIINNCLVILRNQIENKIEVEKKYTSQPFILIGNEGKLHQAILNILSNAVQAIDDKGKIKIKTKKTNQILEIKISDTGCGISPENLSKIFDPFFTTKEAGKGTGLGLSITYNIFAEHNGSIHIESKTGKGTSVYIKLPLN
jgi:PAS domain S-box-containing protein